MKASLLYLSRFALAWGIRFSPERVWITHCKRKQSIYSIRSNRFVLPLFHAYTVDLPSLYKFRISFLTLVLMWNRANISLDNQHLWTFLQRVTRSMWVLNYPLCNDGVSSHSFPHWTPTQVRWNMYKVALPPLSASTCDFLQVSEFRTPPNKVFQLHPSAVLSLD